MSEAKGKFYPHDVDAQIKKCNHFSQLSKIKHPGSAATPTIEYQIIHLIDIAKNGLPDCYTSFGDFLFDFWPNFTWDVEKSLEEAKAVFADPRVKKIIPILNMTWNIDMEKILTAAPTEEL
jgi:hypothetical protein